VLEAHGLGPKDFKPLELPINEALIGLRQKETDAVIQVIGAPADSVRNALVEIPLRLVPLSQRAVAALAAAKAGYFAYTIVNREFLIVTYRTDPDALAAVIPAPLEMTDPVVKFEFIRMPDSTGFGDYTEAGQVIPVKFRGELGSYVHAMFLDCEPPIAGGREIWGFPKKLASPVLRVEKDTIGGILRYGPVRWRLRPWATSIGPCRTTRSWPRFRHRTSCSRSFRMWMAPRASASWCATSAKT